MSYIHNINKEKFTNQNIFILKDRISAFYFDEDTFMIFFYGETEFSIRFDSQTELSEKFMPSFLRWINSKSEEVFTIKSYRKNDSIYYGENKNE